jgi:shikimate kinase
MKIFIIGYMGSGKSTLGPKLADEMNLPFLDLDHEFESRYKITISDFFSKYGEKQFREIEKNLLFEICNQDDFVLATGGGTPCFDRNIEFMNSKGITVYLKVPVEILIKRLKVSPRRRPILKTLDSNDYEKQLQDHLKLREPVYMQAHIIIDGSIHDSAGISEIIRKKALELSGV